MSRLFFRQSKVEKERRRRILLSLWAYAYEFAGEPMVSDAVFDEEAKKVDLSIDTGNVKMDNWFRNNFVDYSGSWIGKHPELDRIKDIYDAIQR